MNEPHDALIPALIKARGEFPPIRKDSTNPHFKSKFASLDAILDAVVPVLAKNGLAIVQPVVGNAVCTILLHTSGGKIESSYPLPEGLVAEPQKLGAAVTYARRYSLASLLAVCADEDDDAETTTTRNGAAPANRYSEPAPPKDDPKAHHSAERRKAAAALFKGLEAFGDAAPWDSIPKRRVLKEVFGTDQVKSITAMTNTEFLQLYSDNYAAVLEAAIRETKTAQATKKADEEAGNVPF